MTSFKFSEIKRKEKKRKEQIEQYKKWAENVLNSKKEGIEYLDTNTGEWRNTKDDKYIVKKGLVALFYKVKFLIDAFKSIKVTVEFNGMRKVGTHTKIPFNSKTYS